MNKLTTFEAMDKCRAFLDRVIELEGELTPEMELELQITKEQLDTKIEGNGYYYQELSDYTDKLKNRYKDLKTQYEKRLSFIENQKDKIKDRIKMVLDVMQTKKIDTGTAQVSLRKTKKVVEIFDESLLPARFTKETVTITVDKEAIRAAIEAGEIVEGVRLIENEYVKIEINELKQVGEKR